jgi:hypothetical protein
MDGEGGRALADWPCMYGERSYCRCDEWAVRDSGVRSVRAIEATGPAAEWPGSGGGCRWWLGRQDACAHLRFVVRSAPEEVLAVGFQGAGVPTVKAAREVDGAVPAFADLLQLEALLVVLPAAIPTYVWPQVQGVRTCSCSRHWPVVGQMWQRARLTTA